MDSTDLVIVPQLPVAAGRCYIIMRQGSRLMKIPAHLRAWLPDDRNSVLFEVTDMGMLEAKPWVG